MLTRARAQIATILAGLLPHATTALAAENLGLQVDGRGA